MAPLMPSMSIKDMCQWLGYSQNHALEVEHLTKIWLHEYYRNPTSTDMMVVNGPRELNDLGIDMLNQWRLQRHDPSIQDLSLAPNENQTIGAQLAREVNRFAMFRSNELEHQS